MKLTTITACLLLAAAPLAAQGPALGIELGYSRASFSGRNSGGVKLHEGAVAGAYMSVDLFSGFAFRPGILLSTKGGSTEVATDSVGGRGRLDLELVYIDLPVLFRARMPLIGQGRFLLTGGALPGIRIGCATDRIAENETPLERTPCRAGALKPFDLAVVGGVGFGFPVERSFLAIEIRATQGVVSVVDDGDLKNRALTILLTVPF